MAKAGRPMKLRTYLERQINNGATAVVLHRANVNGTLGPKIERFKLEANTDCDAIGETIQSVADSDAEGIGQRQVYTVKATIGDEVVGHHSMTCVPVMDDGEGSPTPDAPNPAGLLAQVMRHNEAIMRANHALTVEIVNQANRNAENTAGLLETMRKGFESGLEARGELATRNIEHETATALKMAELEIQQATSVRKDRLLGEGLEMLKPMIPAIAVKFMEAQAGKGGDSGDGKKDDGN